MKRVTFVLAIMLLALSTGAFASYDFGTAWGIQMSTEACPLFGNNQQLTFTAPPTGVAYEVGGYKYTKVGSTWEGGASGFAEASPGYAYPDLQRDCDAMGLFFMAKPDAAYFRIITGMPERGITATTIGYGNRQFGPGDLKIDVNGGSTYGVGLRNGGLKWDADPASTAPWFQVWDSNTINKLAMTARDAGDIGQIREDPIWGHVDNHVLTPYDPHGTAFYVAGTGTAAGTATINVQNTGVFLDGVELYSYEAIVPWSAIGITSSAFDLEASWRPDCGNDLIYKQFTGDKPSFPVVPEPYSIMLAAMGLSAVAVYRKRR